MYLYLYLYLYSYLKAEYLIQLYNRVLSYSECLESIQCIVRVNWWMALSLLGIRISHYFQCAATYTSICIYLFPVVDNQNLGNFVENQSDGATRCGKYFDDMFNHLDTISDHDRRTNTWKETSGRVQDCKCHTYFLASCGKNYRPCSVMSGCCREAVGSLFSSRYVLDLVSPEVVDFAASGSKSCTSQKQIHLDIDVNSKVSRFHVCCQCQKVLECRTMRRLTLLWRSLVERSMPGRHGQPVSQDVSPGRLTLMMRTTAGVLVTWRPSLAVNWGRPGRCRTDTCTRVYCHCPLQWPELPNSSLHDVECVITSCVDVGNGGTCTFCIRLHNFSSVPFFIQLQSIREQTVEWSVTVASFSSLYLKRLQHTYSPTSHSKQLLTARSYNRLKIWPSIEYQSPVCN